MLELTNETDQKHNKNDKNDILLGVTRVHG